MISLVYIYIYIYTFEEFEDKAQIIFYSWRTDTQIELVEK